VVIDATRACCPACWATKAPRRSRASSKPATAKAAGLPALDAPGRFRGWKAPEFCSTQSRGDTPLPKESAIEKTARLRRDLMKEGPESGE